MKTKRNTKFWPPRYYIGLTQKQKEKRYKEINKGKNLGYKNPKAYLIFKTNKKIKTKPSKYSRKWNKVFPLAKSLKQRADASGIPIKYINEVYKRGRGAWSSGHAPGATPEQWGYARVSSFLLCGKTHYSTDSDLVRKAKAASASARTWWKRCAPSQLTA